MKKKTEEVIAEVTEVVEVKGLSEKEELEVVYKFLKDRGLNSIGDVENRIAKLQ